MSGQPGTSRVPPGGSRVPLGGSKDISLPVESGEQVSGDLVVPAGAAGIVVFAHGSGSSRLSSRNRRVAATLHEAGFATLLFDLLTPTEEERDDVTGELRFDIPFLAERLRAVTDWVGKHAELSALPLGYFGASTGAAAALVAAAGSPRRVPPGERRVPPGEREDQRLSIDAIVSRGGRPDLAGDALALVDAPTLLIVGSLDLPVIEMNRAAYERLHSREKRLVIVPGASHLFEEPGKLDEVARLAADWFERHLAPPPQA
jgi:putative phosphoribosyl transferase